MSNSDMTKSEYPFPELLPLLRIERTAHEYRAVVAQLSYHYQKREATHRIYHNFLPDYIYAHCPICRQICHEPIDTYALPTNDLKFGAHGPFHQDYPQAYPLPCKHYLGTHSFLHLHEQLPDEVPNPLFPITFGEVPYVTPWLFDGISAYAILHALPICRIENEKFIPRYTRFILTYFSSDPRALIDQVYEPQQTLHPYLLASPFSLGRNLLPPSIDLSFIPHKMRGKYIERYDLQRWAAAGKLGYLDFTSPKLFLKIGGNLQLPDIYRTILGRRYSFMWDSRSKKLLGF
jgi:hypothetical protein